MARAASWAPRSKRWRRACSNGPSPTWHTSSLIGTPSLIWQVEEDVELDMRIRIVDGDTVVADTKEEGSFLKACRKFEAFVQARIAA
mmetsp:Transcript_41138/g.102333  ORF Transcript_41138/g.102333 Transcript_41138/m.102333 type:complete len:87 (-) Transcript_41138:661-921(-)